MLRRGLLIKWRQLLTMRGLEALLQKSETVWLQWLESYCFPFAVKMRGSSCCCCHRGIVSKGIVLQQDSLRWTGLSTRRRMVTKNGCLEESRRLLRWFSGFWYLFQTRGLREYVYGEILSLPTTSLYAAALRWSQDKDWRTTRTRTWLSSSPPRVELTKNHVLRNYDDIQERADILTTLSWLHSHE